MEKVFPWRKLDGTRIKQPIEEEIKNILLREQISGNEIRVAIGTDSQVNGRESAFATVIVFIRKGSGGFMYIQERTTTLRMSLRERMMTEVSRSVESAYSLCDVFAALKTEMEVHVDINTNPDCKSNVALKDAMGYILGMGYAFKAKPDAFASSCCADKMVN